MKKTTINRKSEAATMPHHLFEVITEKWESAPNSWHVLAITALMFAGRNPLTPHRR